MNKAVLDASVILTVVRKERGLQQAMEVLYGGLLSSVNLSEVASKLADEGSSLSAIERMASALPFVVVPFDRQHALTAGMLRPATAKLGLSLGDRACLSLAMQTGLPVFTADRAWAELDLGVEVRLIR